MEKFCLNCSKKFITYPSRIKRGGGIYCSSKCFAIHKDIGHYERTESHKLLMSAKLKGRPANWKAINAAANARRGVPSSEKCKQVASKRWSGSGNPKWRGGTARLPYAGNWQSVRKIVIKRDKICQDCKKTKEEVRRFDVHHMDRNRENNDLRNLILLCSTCHYKRHWA
jgi:hypothetical protein